MPSVTDSHKDSVSFPPHQSAQSSAVVISTHEWLGRCVRFLLVSFALLTATSLMATNDAWGQEDQVPTSVIEEMQTIIAAQIDAFRADDAEAAYAFAAPAIRQRFPTASRFLAMVRRGYPAVYAPQSFRFDAVALTPSGPAQRVDFVGEDGQVWAGIYTFVEDEDGMLAISGVFLQQRNERQI